MPTAQDCSIIVPTYSARGLLERYLPVLVREFGGRSEILVVDDAGADDSVEMVRESFPDVRPIVRPENGGFSAAANDGIRASAGTFTVLLNNDVEVTPGFLDPLLRMFEDESVFAVSPRILLPSRGNLDEGAKTGRWRHGLFYTDQRRDVEQVTPVLYTTGCAAVYRRSMLDALGGFDEAYSPFYWEDVDLGYRAWKRGWRSLYQPASTVYHQHSASTSKLSSAFTGAVKARNALLFVWRNIEDRGLLLHHRLWLPAVLAKQALLGNRAFVRGWTQALVRRADACRARRGDGAARRLSDREIFAATGIQM